jgi:hypothetical protein
VRKTIYIDADEEITGVIDKIRTEEADDIYLVIPKGALITQGVINLKLLKKEADKIGKSITVITGDPLVQKVIGRLGIQVGKQSDQFAPDNDSKEFSKEAVVEKVSSEVADEFSDKHNPESEASQMGSSSFFQGGGLPQQAEKGVGRPKIEKKAMELPPRKIKEELYTKQESVEEKSVDGGKGGMIPQKKILPIKNQDPLPSYQPKKPEPKPEIEKPKIPERPKNPLLAGKKAFISRGNSNRMSNSGLPSGYAGGQANNSKPKGFFDKDDYRKAENFFKKGVLKKKLKPAIKGEKSGGGIFKYFVLSVVFLSAICVGGYWVYSKYPVVVVGIYPRGEELTKDMKVVIVDSEETVGSEDEVSLKGRFFEDVIEKEMNFKATGEGNTADDGKARGKVKIINKYSDKAQALVATTRILSEEGKLFRLVNTITVPGMNGEEPGVIETSVVADNYGEDFNIDPTSFTIEGFKGNPKYEKFEVVSRDKMTGGGEPDPNKKVAVVTASDLEKARKEALSKMEEELAVEIQKRLESGEKVVIDSVERGLEAAQSSYKEGEVTDEFDFIVREKIKVIAFVEKDLNAIYFDELKKETKEGYEMSELGEVDYKKSILDIEKKKLSLYVNVSAMSWPQIAESDLTSEILGNTDEESLKKVIANYPEIEKIEIDFSPAWLSWLPLNEDKIKIEEVKE